MLICWNDTETTGLDDNYHEVIQITMIIEKDGKFVDTINIRMRPDHPERISEEALEKQGITIEEIMQWPERSVQFEKLIAFLDKHVDKFNKYDKMYMAGYHNLFDKKFLRAFFEQQSHKYFGSYFFFEVMDVMTLAMLLRIMGALDTPNLKLETVANALGIPFGEGEAHDALYDVKKTIEIFYKMDNMLELKEKKL